MQLEVTLTLALTDTFMLTAALTDAAAALPELEEAVAMAEKFLPPEHPHLKKYRETLARCRAALAEQGKPDAKGGGR